MRRRRASPTQCSSKRPVSAHHRWFFKRAHGRQSFRTKPAIACEAIAATYQSLIAPRRRHCGSMQLLTSPERAMQFRKERRSLAMLASILSTLFIMIGIWGLVCALYLMIYTALGNLDLNYWREKLFTRPRSARSAGPSAVSAIGDVAGCLRDDAHAALAYLASFTVSAVFQIERFLRKKIFRRGQPVPATRAQLVSPPGESGVELEELVQTALAKYGDELARNHVLELSANIKSLEQLQSAVADIETCLMLRLEERLSRELERITFLRCQWRLKRPLYATSTWNLLLMLAAGSDPSELDLSDDVLSLAAILGRSLPELSVTLLLKIQRFTSFRITVEASVMTIRARRGWRWYKIVDQTTFPLYSSGTFWYAMSSRIWRHKANFDGDRDYSPIRQCHIFFDGAASDWLGFSMDRPSSPENSITYDNDI
jgi:hypothetical protein